LYVDIEGAESLLFDNEMGCIVSNCIGVLVEFHPEIIGEDKKIKYVNELKKHYVLISENGNVKLFLKRNYLDSGK
jgi:hypothetical protein